MNDRLTSGATAGMIASIAKTISNFIFYKLGIIGHTYPSLIAVILLKTPEATAHSFWPFLLGLFINIVNGGILGIIIIYILKMVGKQYLWFKGLLFGSLIWLIGPTILLPICYPGLTLNFHYVSLLDHWIFGLVTVYLIAKLYSVND